MYKLSHLNKLKVNAIIYKFALSVLPIYLYFGNSFYPVVLAFALIFIISIGKKCWREELWGYCAAYILLFLLQFILLDNLNLERFVNRAAAIILFIFSLVYCRTVHNSYYDKFINASFFFTIFYVLYSSLLYVYGFEKYLLPGTCDSKNLNEFGFLRCSTFQEGNYYATYLSLILLIYRKSLAIYLASIIGITFAGSPVGILCFIYFSIRRVASAKSSIILCFFFCMVSALYLLYFLDFIDSFHFSPSSSLMERIEFIRAAMDMFRSSPIIGVGVGQYTENIHLFTIYEHLYHNAVFEGWTYVANSGFPDIISEQGLFGVLLFLIFIYGSIKKIEKTDDRLDLLFILATISIAIPSFFQVYIGVLLGVYTNKCITKKQYT